MDKIDIKNDFCVFILSHNNANKIDTLALLKKIGYDGNWFVVVSTDDRTLDDYIAKIPNENLLIFDKDDINCDLMVSRCRITKRSSAVYARNFIVDYVKDHPDIKYFLMADDDVKKIVHKVNYNGKMKEVVVKDINPIFKIFIDYLETSDSLAGIAPGFGAGFMGGVNAIKKIPREVFQFVVLKSKNVKNYTGFVDEDYLLCLSNFENVYVSFYGMAIITPIFGTGSGGIEYGQFSPSLFSYALRPSGIKPKSFLIRTRYNKYCYPKILNEKYKK